MINFYYISIEGKNTKYFLNILLKQRINIEKIIYKKDKLILKVSYEEYKKIKNIKTSYTIKIIKTSGVKKLRHLYQKYKISIFVFVISVFFIVFMTNLILFISVSTDNKEFKNLIIQELKNSDITLYSYKKSYSNFNNIALKIKNNNLDKIEWIELEKQGIVLYVKVIPRINKITNNNRKYQDIVALKDGYIKKINSSNGQVLKNIDDYVKKGEVIISGNIFKNDKIVAKTRATGDIYAEVWNIVKINNSLFYKDLVSKNWGEFYLSFSIYDKEFKLLSIPWKINAKKRRIIFKNNDFYISLNSNRKYYYKTKKYNSFQLQKILELRAKEKVLNGLDNEEYIILQKTLKKYTKNDKMYIEVFFKCYENIALEKDIQEIKEKKDD